MKAGVNVLTDDVAKLMATIKGIAAAGQVYVGIPDSTDGRDDGPIGNAAIGYINEFGSAAQGIPARPFLSTGVEKVTGKCMDEQRKGILSALTDFNPSAIARGQNRAGLIAQNSVRATITAGDGFEPLSAATLAARKRRKVTRTKPLIDTGSLRTSITYVIRDE